MDKSYSFYRDSSIQLSDSDSEEVIDNSGTEDDSYSLLRTTRRNKQTSHTTAVISDSDSDVQDVTDYQNNTTESFRIFDLTTDNISLDDKDVTTKSKLDRSEASLGKKDTTNDSVIGRRGPRACKRLVIDSDTDSDLSGVTETKMPPFKMKADSSHRRVSSQNVYQRKSVDSVKDILSRNNSDCSGVMETSIPVVHTSHLAVSDSSHLNVSDSFHLGVSDSSHLGVSDFSHSLSDFHTSKTEQKSVESLESVLAANKPNGGSEVMGTKLTSFNVEANSLNHTVSQNLTNIKSDEKTVEQELAKHISECTSDIESVFSDEIPDDDLVMSAATRMSIHGIRPKDMPSDESDFLISDSDESETELKPNPHIDQPRIKVEDIKPILGEVKKNNLIMSNDDTIIIDDNEGDNSICIVEKHVPTIDLSHIDDDGFEPFDKSRKSTKPVGEQETMKKYLMPASYPNSRLVYVSKEVKDSEMNKLAGLREDLVKLKYLLDTLDIKTLPDRGVKLSSRLQQLEEEVKRQAERVSNLIVESKNPTKQEMLGDVQPKSSWEDQAAAINQVQPTHYGDKGMMNHLAERTTILERLRDLHASLASRPGEKEKAAQPRGVRAPLMPHQAHALAWLTWRETQRPRGGILADDMGLGKTLTMISLIVQAKEKDLMMDDDEWNDKENSKMVSGGTLVICPASLLSQWAGEVTARCQKHLLDVEVHHGPNRETKPHRLARRDLVVTTYNIVARDLDKGGVVMKIAWSRVILDEAHIVRNYKSLTARAVFALTSRCRWCLTGTPVQNKDLDVFALLKFLKCSPFDEIVMWKKWIDNKSAGGQERLSTLMRCLLLRRTKTQLQSAGALQSLPTKTLVNIEVVLSREEMNVYQKVLVFSKTLFAQFLHQRAEKESDMAGGFLATSSKPNEAYNKMHSRMVALQGAKPVKSHEILVLLLRLRQLCCHAGLITAMLSAEDAAEGGVEVEEDPASLDLLEELHKLTLKDNTKHDKSVNSQHSQESESDLGKEEGTSVNEALRSVLSPSNPVFDLQRSSAKIAAIIDCLNTKVFTKPGDKAVIVSQWTSVLSLIERTLSVKVGMTTLSGKVPVSARGAIVKQFNDPNSKVRVLLLSLCAGGVGLNLIGGNHLLLVDLHWNPQLEAQAQDRIYRVGQSKPVHIYKFMCVDTIEQSIKKLQDHKLQIADGVLTGAKYNKSSKLSIEDLKVLFNM